MRALIIEDNEDNMELICFILETHGFETVRAQNGQDGFSIAQTCKPDFILLDIQLPDIPGTEVLRMLRGSPASAKLPVIAVTSYAMAGDRKKLLQAGCDGYIEKPIDPLRIIHQINEIVGSRK